MVEQFVAIATHAQWHIAIFLHKTPARAKILEIKNFHMASDHLLHNSSKWGGAGQRYRTLAVPVLYK